MTRARGKRFKEELNNFVRRVLQENDSVFTAEGERKMVLLIKFDPEVNHDANHAKIWRDPNQISLQDRILNGFEWNRDPTLNRKHEPWYARTPQSAMEGLIDKSMKATEFLR